jgi:hypothetical protein
MVVATIALFAALGGGYATAFSGSGTLQKAALDGPDTSFETVRTLNGFGTLKARCDTGDDEVEYALHNTTISPIEYRVSRIGAGVAASQAGTVSGGNETALAIGSGSAAGGLIIHLSKTATPGTKAQVLLAATNEGPVANECTQTRVRVMALNTVE